MKKHNSRHHRFTALKALAITGLATVGLSSGILAAGNTAPAAATPPKPQPSQPSDELFQKWDDQLFSEMQNFEKRMDDLFSTARQNTVGAIPEIDHLAGNFNSSVKLTDQAHQYIVRFALPNTEMEKANVTIKDGILHITANEQSETFGKYEPSPKSNTSAKDAKQPGVPASIHYEEYISLPGPVDAASMKVQRSVGFVTVTVAKAEGHSAPVPTPETKK